MVNASPAPLTPQSIRFGAETLASVDPDIHHLYTRLGPPHLWTREPGFATLIQIILEQQVSLKAARTMYQRLVTYLGEMTPQSTIDTGEAGLKQLGLTRQKARYCCGLAGQVIEGRLNLDELGELDDNVGRQALLAVPGLGPWTVDVYYMMALRRPDVWPRGDLALAMALQDVKGLDKPATPDEQATLCQAWAPWRAVAARMFWMHYLDARGQEVP